MTRPLRCLRLVHRRVTRDAEAGTSMVEVIVAMVLMTICGAIFTGAMVTLFRAHDAAQALTTSAQQTNQAYQSLDKTVRYAAGVSEPGVSAGTGSTGDWYVELSDTTSGREVCTQLRLDKPSGRLQQRTWTVGSTTPVPSAWTALASGLTNTTAKADQPFALVKPTGSISRQRLTITLVAQAGPPSSPKTSRSSITFTALNSSVAQVSNSICQQVGRP